MTTNSTCFRTALLSLIILLQFNFSNAQSTPFAWTFLLDGYNDVDIADLVVDDSGNTYVAANYTSDLTIPGLNKKMPTPGHVHGLILKLDPQGKALWAHGLKSSFDNRIRDIALAPNGDVLLTGFGDGLLQFPGWRDTLKAGSIPDGNHMSRNLKYGAYAARYSPDGDRKWVQYFDAGWAEGLAIGANKKDDVFMTYYFGRVIRQGKKILDTITDRNVDYRYCLTKMDGNGKLKSTQTLINYKAESYTIHSNLQFDHDDNLILYGTFTKHIYFTPTDSLTNNSYYESTDCYIAKYKPKGKLLWTKKIGGQGVQQLNGLTIAPDNSMYITGSYDYECVLGDGINVLQKSKFEYKSGNNLFYTHLFADGEPDFIRYDNSKGWSSYLSGQDIAVDNDYRAHIIGYFTDTINFDGKKIMTGHNNNTGFYSVWQRDSLKTLSKIATTNGFLMSTKIGITNNRISIGGYYYGDSPKLFLKNGTANLSNKDHGRNTFITGGTIDKADTTEQLYVRDDKAMRLELVKTLTACSTANDSAKANAWLPLNLAKTNTPCGDAVKGMAVTLFPNPTAGQTNIKFTGITGIAQVEVFAESGQLVLSNRIQEITDGRILSLDLHALANGNYLIRITHAEFQKGLRLVKIR